MISPKLIPAIILAIAALRGQNYPIVGTTAYCGYRLTAPILIAQNTPAISAHPLTAPRWTDATTICGKDDRNPTPNVDLIQVSCIDYDRLREIAPQHPWPVGKVTQVLIHVREGDAVRVTVDGVQKFADLIRDAWGRLIALIQFDGTDYKAVAVKVYRAVEE